MADLFLDLAAQFERGGFLPEAEALYRRLLAAEPQRADIWLRLARLCQTMGRTGPAIAAYRQCLEADPGCAEALLALVLDQGTRGRLDQALAGCRHLVGSDPASAIGWYNFAVAAAGLGRPAVAMAAYRRAALCDPAVPAAVINRADLLRRAGQAVQACRELRLSLQFSPADPRLLLMLAVASGDAGADTGWRRWLRRSLAVDPTATEALLTAGNVRRQEDAVAAVAWFRQVLQRDPAHGGAVLNLAQALADQAPVRADPASGAPDLTGRWLRRAARLAPHDGRVALALANRLGATVGAVDLLRRALTLEPALIEAWFNLGQILHQRVDSRAKGCFDRVLALDPGDGRGWIGRCCAELPVIPASPAVAAASRAGYAAWLDRFAAWVGQTDTAALARAAAAIGVIQPFYLAYQGHNDRALQARYGDLIARLAAARWPDHCPAHLADQARPLMMPEPDDDGRWRIGFVSAYFRAHSNWKIPIQGWLTGLDRSRFRIFGYHLGSTADSVTGQAAGLCDDFIAGPRSIGQWIARIAADRPQVLIYPGIGMDPDSLNLAALRLAPVQAASWGHPETTGLPTIDWFLSADAMEPPDGQDHYTERLVRLPGLSIDWQIPPVGPAPSRRHLGLADSDIVFWCCQSLYKYLPEHDGVFPQIARQLPQARFLFIGRAGTPVCDIFIHRLTAAFAAAGLEAGDHVRLMAPLPMADFIAMAGAADLFLDSIGWSGCNSLMEALAAGLPAITWPGETMRSRHGAAILERLGLMDSIARSRDDYVALAVRLGRDAAARADLRQRIAAARPRLAGDGAAARALAQFLTKVIKGYGCN